jgi:hypothetical protein
VTVTLIVLALARDTDRIVSIYVATPKVAKASTTRVAVTSVIAGIIVLTFANGNTAYNSNQRILTKEEDSVQLTSLYFLV